MNGLKNALIVIGLACMVAVFMLGSWTVWQLNVWAWGRDMILGGMVTTTTLLGLLKMIFMVQEKVE